jgi:hypothetical protein
MPHQKIKVDGVYLTDIANGKVDNIVSVLRSNDILYFEGSNFNFGTDGSGLKNVNIFTNTVGSYLQLGTVSSVPAVKSIGSAGLVLNGATYVRLLSAAGNSQFFDCGNLFRWRDVSSTVRMELNSATGALDCCKGTGDFSINGTVTINNAREGTFNKLTVDKLAGQGSVLVRSNTGATSTQHPQVQLIHTGSTPSGLSVIMDTVGTEVIDNVRFRGPNALDFKMQLEAPSTKACKLRLVGGGGSSLYGDVNVDSSGNMSLRHNGSFGKLIIGDVADIIIVDPVNDNVGIGGNPSATGATKLKITGGFEVTGDITRAGKSIDTPTTQNITASNQTINVTSTIIYLTSTGDFTLNGTPVLNTGTDGQRILIYNKNTGTGTLTFSNVLATLELNASTRALTPGDSIGFLNVNGKWVESSFSVNIN